jgi:hypothetical protein
LPQIVGRYGYADTVSCWLSRPLSDGQIGQLVANTGKRPKVTNELFDPSGRYVQRVELRQPNDIALDVLRRHHDPHLIVTRVHLALDLVTATTVVREALRNYLLKHLVQPWYRGDGLITFEDTVYRYPSRRHDQMVMYDDKPCRVTGEVDCVHLEWRAQRHRSAVRAGAETIEDLLAFDHRAFWDRKLRLLELDYSKLGRAHLRHHGLTKRRSADLTSHGASGHVWDWDVRAGYIVADVAQRAEPTPAAELPKHCAEILRRRLPFDTSRVFNRLPNDWLLPD